MSNTNSDLLATRQKNLEKISKGIFIGADPEELTNKAVKELETIKEWDFSNNKNPNLYKVFSTLEFDKGTFLTFAFPTTYQSFAIDFSRRLQKEFDCQTPSEKSLAELVAINFCRILYIQKKINDYIERGTVTDIGVGYLSFLSKELDRANRHYFTAIQTIKAIKQPNIEMNIKTQTAVIGQNQVIQNKNI